MHSIKTTGIVIKGTNFGEADKILTVFTERLGKIRVLAKGIRKIKSHLAGALEPFILSDLLLYEGKTFYSITGASIVDQFPRLHSDSLSDITRAFYVGELIDRFLEDNQKSDSVFRLFVDILTALERGTDGERLIWAYELKLIEAAGFRPELHECVHCKEEITPSNNFWDQVEGGLICASCNAEKHHGISIENNTIKILRFILDHSLSAMLKVQLSESTKSEACNIIRSYIDHILERDLKSRRLMGDG